MSGRNALIWMPLLIALAALGGCQSPPQVSDTVAAEGDRAGHAYLVYGLFDVFSQGLNKIETRLQDEGVDAHLVSGPQWGKLSRQIVDAHEAGELNEPLVIVGHSLGADDAVRIARSLEKHGIEVDSLALIDPTIPPEIPGNVRRVYNLYKANPATDWIPLFRGVKVTGASDTTEVVNFNLRDSDSPEQFRGANHFNIEEFAGVHDLIVDEVLRWCPPRAQYASPSGVFSSGEVLLDDVNGK